MTPLPSFPPPFKRAREAVYTHADGSAETVTVVKRHSEAEGGGYTVHVPSLGRERQTVDSRLAFAVSSPYFAGAKQGADEVRPAAGAVAAPGALRGLPLKEPPPSEQGP